MVLNLQEMGLVVMGHKFPVRQPGGRGQRSRVWYAVGLCAGHHTPQLGSTLADLQTNAHCHPQQVSCLSPTTKAGKTQASPVK